MSDEKSASVPIEPTTAMIRAAAFQVFPSYAGQENHQYGYDIVSEDDVRAIWKAMLLASPNPPAGGVSLRDHFAAAALDGILACTRDYTGAPDKASRCKMAFAYADEMIKQRGNP